MRRARVKKEERSEVTDESCGREPTLGTLDIWRKRTKTHILKLFNIVYKNQISQEWETGMVVYIKKVYSKNEQKANVNIRGITLSTTA